MNRTERRAHHAKLKQLRTPEVDTVITSFMESIYKGNILQRLSFCFNIILKRHPKPKRRKPLSGSL